LTVCQAELFVKDKAAPTARAPASACAAGARAGGGAALGTLTESSGQFRTVTDEETGEIQRFRLDEQRREWVAVEGLSDADAIRSARAGRLMLQRAARKVLRDVKTPQEKVWRVTGCTWRRTARQVSVYQAMAAKRAHYKGLMVCGSVWTCPCCAAKVSESRRAEVLSATRIHKERGGALYMLTLTFSHSRSDDVAKLVKALREGLCKFRDHRSYKGVLKLYGFGGLIRALEVTYGEGNGWHPHVHELWLMDRKLSDVQLRVMRRTLFDVWKVACLKAGLGAPTRERGVKFEEAESGSAYVSKWGIDSELTKAHTKKGREGRSTPWDLLRQYGDGDVRSGMLFRTFATAFFGSRQLFWSPGLKAELGLAELSDQEIAEADEVESVLIGHVSADEWRLVLRQPWEARAVLLEIAEAGGREGIRRFVAGLSSGRAAVP
jgi:Replication protein.